MLFGPSQALALKMSYNHGDVTNAISWFDTGIAPVIPKIYI